MPSLGTPPKSARWLLPIAFVFTIPVLLTGKVGNLPLLIPLWFLTFYGLIRADQVMGVRQLILIQVALGAIIMGMLLGPWQSDPALNRIGHGLVALALAAIICAELKPFGPLWLTCLCGLGIAITLGVCMELAEAFAGMGDVVLVTRWKDTIADLAANLIGSSLGALAWFYYQSKKAL